MDRWDQAASHPPRPRRDLRCLRADARMCDNEAPSWLPRIPTPFCQRRIQLFAQAVGQRNPHDITEPRSPKALVCDFQSCEEGVRGHIQPPIMSEVFLVLNE